MKKRILREKLAKELEEENIEILELEEEKDSNEKNNKKIKEIILYKWSKFTNFILGGKN
ncbi:MAG: hypothetical protein J6O41_00230 [Clostridia bacterium]|nr:hypothetical protein [Clostridia bacterium]